MMIPRYAKRLDGPMYQQIGARNVPAEIRLVIQCIKKAEAALP